MGGGSANRVAGVTAHTDDTETCRDSRCRPATGAGRHSFQVIGICGDAIRRADGLFRAKRPLRHIGFRNDDGVRFAELPNHECVIGGYAVFQCYRPAAGRHVCCVVIVFQQHWRTEQRS